MRQLAWFILDAENTGLLIAVESIFTPGDTMTHDDVTGEASSAVSEMERLKQENARLLDDLEQIYTQFLSLKRETDVSYGELRERNRLLERKIDELQQA